jgi:hypothetical protein
MRRIIPPSTERAVARVGGRARNLERRYLPTDQGMWPNVYNFPLFNVAGQRKATNWFHLNTAPPVTVPYGAVIDNFTATTAADGDEFYVAARLGPFGSVWSWGIGFVGGPDYGKVKVEMATLTESVYDNAGGPSLEDLASATYVSRGNIIDAYRTADIILGDNGIGDFRIMGQDGDPVTAVSVAPGSDNTATFHTDGGAGLFAFKFKINGKNAGSSGYKAAFWELALYRTTDYSEVRAAG